MNNIKQKNDALTLDGIPSGEKVQIHSISGGWGIRQRLNQIGLHTGDTLLVKRGCHYGGPVLVHFRHADIAIGRGMAHMINVTRLDENKNTSDI